MARLIRLRRRGGVLAALRRANRAAAGMLRVWTPKTVARRPPARAAPVDLPAGTTSAVSEFGTNPGALRMFVHVPRQDVPAGMPLIVVLHGCRQNAGDFARHAGWIACSELLGIPLVLPEQTAENNRHGCFNWFRPQDVARGHGEAMSIRQMLRWAMAHFGSDRRRIFVVGLSAGGAMAAALLAAYPAVFAAGAVVAGMPVGAAVTPGGALLRMRHVDRFRTRAGLVAAIRAAAPPRASSWPRLSIWQGGQDRTVHPGNAEMLAAQWSALHNLDEAPLRDTQLAPGLRHRQWGARREGVVELWTLETMGHGFPIAEERHAAPWVLAAGVPAARRICDFWGLTPP